MNCGGKNFEYSNGMEIKKEVAFSRNGNVIVSASGDCVGK